MHELFPLGTTHLPLLPQLPAKAHRSPEEHCASFVQLRAFCVLWVFELRAAVDWGWTFKLPAQMQKKNKPTAYIEQKRTLFITF